MGAPGIGSAGLAASTQPSTPAVPTAPSRAPGAPLNPSGGLAPRGVPAGAATLAPRSAGLHAFRAATKQVARALHYSGAFVGLSAGPAVSRGDSIKGLPGLAKPARTAAPLTPSAVASIDLARAALASLHESVGDPKVAAKQQQKLASDALGFALTADPAPVTALGTELRTMFDRLAGVRGGKPDALGAALVAGSAAQLFGPPANQDVELALEAVRGLTSTTAARLLQALSSALAAPQLAVPSTLQLAAALAAQPGGPERLARVVGEISAGPSVQSEALAVGFKALQTATELGPKLGDAQRQFLQAAVDHAGMRSAGTGTAGIDEDALCQGRIAYQAVRNGLVDRSEGSNYQQANKWLEKISGEWIDRTAVRNTRVAKNSYGGAVNAASALVPGNFGKTIPFRKTAVLEAAKAATAAGLLPAPGLALRSLDRAAADLLATFASQAKQRAAQGAPNPPTHQQGALEGLLAGTLHSTGLGGNPIVQALPDETPRDMLPGTSLSRWQMLAARLTVSDAHFKSLGPEFAAEWQHLSRTKPNVAHVLAMLSGHLRVQQAAAAQPATQSAGQRTAAAAPSLAERGQRSDAMAQAAVGKLSSIAAQADVFASAHPGSPGRELAQLARESQGVLGSLQPAVRLQAVPPPLLDAIETRMGATFAGLPLEVQKNWAQLKAQSPAGAEVATLIHAALEQAALPAAGSAAGKALRQALDEAREPLQDAVQDSRMRRFDEGIADMLTTWGDLRDPRDLAAMMASATRRLDLSGRMTMFDQRGTGLDAGALLKSVPIPFFNVLAAAFKQMDRTIDITAQGHVLEMFIGQSDGSSLKAGLHLDAAKIDPVSAALSALPGVSVELKAGIEHERQRGNGAGVTLRIESRSDSETLRRKFAAVLEDLAQASSLVNGNKNYPDALAMLLDRHEDLSVSNTDTKRKSHLGKTSASANAALDFGASNLDPTGVSKLFIPSPSIGAELASGSRRGSAALADTTGAVQINEVQVSARHNVDVSVMPMGKVWGKGLYAAGGDHTLRTVSRDGTVLAGSTQTTQHFARYEDFVKAVEADRAAWVQLMAERDLTPGRSDADKLAAAGSRLDEMLKVAAASDEVTLVGGRRAEGEFLLVQALLPEAAQMWTDLQAQVHQLRSQGEPEAAQSVQQLVGELADDPRNWAPTELLSGTRGSSTATMTNPGIVQMRQAIGSGGATHMSQRLTAT